MRSASEIAADVLPTAVGPRIATSGGRGSEAVNECRELLIRALAVVGGSRDAPTPFACIPERHLHQMHTCTGAPEGHTCPTGTGTECPDRRCWVGTVCAPTALAHECLPIGHRDGVRHCAGSTHTAPAKHRRCGAGECGASERSASECR